MENFAVMEVTLPNRGNSPTIPRLGTSSTVDITFEANTLSGNLRRVIPQRKKWLDKSMQKTITDWQSSYQDMEATWNTSTYSTKIIRYSVQNIRTVKKTPNTWSFSVYGVISWETLELCRIRHSPWTAVHKTQLEENRWLSSKYPKCAPETEEHASELAKLTY